MLRRAYNWLLKQAERPYALWILSAVSFAESSFFPIPPDPLYLAMLIAKPHQVWRLAFICTLTSVAGGILYAILLISMQLRVIKETISLE